MSTVGVVRPFTKFRDRRGDRRGFAWWLALVVCKPILVALRRADWRGVERLPRSGGAVLAANHVSHIDPLLVAEMLLAQDRVPRFLAKDTLFVGPVLGWWFRAAGHVKVDRAAGRAAYDDAVTAARAGCLLLVYPEASITKRPDGLPMAMKSGAVRIALEGSVPLVPVAQWGRARDSSCLQRQAALGSAAERHCVGRRTHPAPRPTRPRPGSRRGTRSHSPRREADIHGARAERDTALAAVRRRAPPRRAHERKEGSSRRWLSWPRSMAGP